MTQKKRTSRRLQHAARERMKVTGEKYSTALKAVTDADPSTSPARPAGQGEELAPPVDVQHPASDARHRG